MPADPDIFLAPCSRTHKDTTIRYFRETVLEGVSPTEYSVLRAAGYTEPVSLWGVISSKKTTWEQMASGDVVLFYTKAGIYTHAATVEATFTDESLARRIWAPYDEGRTVEDIEDPWMHMFALTNVQEVHIPADILHDALGYDMEYPLGFMRPSDSAHAQLRSDSGSVEAFLNRFRTGESCEGLSEATATETVPRDQPVEHTTTTQIVRSEQFRQEVREAYNERCAVCGVRRVTPAGTPEVEAAHIKPKEAGGPDHVQNGLALCRLHHWAFDAGWFSITDDYRITVRTDPDRDGYEDFSKLDSQQLKLPGDQNRPHPQFLKDHRERHGFEQE